LRALPANARNFVRPRTSLSASDSILSKFLKSLQPREHCFPRPASRHRSHSCGEVRGHFVPLCVPYTMTGSRAIGSKVLPRLTTLGFTDSAGPTSIVMT